MDYIDDAYLNDEEPEDFENHQQRVELQLIVGRVKETATVHTLFAIEFNSYYPLAVGDDDNGTQRKWEVFEVTSFIVQLF